MSNPDDSSCQAAPIRSENVTGNENSQVRAHRTISLTLCGEQVSAAFCLERYPPHMAVYINNFLSRHFTPSPPSEGQECCDAPSAQSPVPLQCSLPAPPATSRMGAGQWPGARR